MKNVSLVGVVGSAICVLSVIGIMVLTAITGFSYWYPKDQFNAYLTVTFEIVALGGIAAANMHRGKGKRIEQPGFWVAVALTAVAAGWCGFTQWEKLREDAHTRAVARVQNTEVYRLARADWQTARAATEMSGYRTENPRPVQEICRCPDTIEAWDKGFREEADRRERVVAERQERMQALIPAPTIDPMAAGRAAAIEAIKLLGFIAFGAGLTVAFGRADGHAQPAQIEPQPRQHPEPRPQQQPPQRARTERRAARGAKRVSGGGIDAEVWQMIEGD